jgi:tape measure domain-containing protein
MALLGGDNEVDILIKTTSDTQGLESTGKSLDKLGGISTKNAAVMGALAGVVSGVTNRAISELGGLVTDAVKRVDTLKNANRTFENMGFSASSTKDMMGLLNKSILGLPTSLDAAVRNVELLASSTNDIGRSQKIFQALNDGIIGFGGTTDQVNTAVIQLSQAFAGGRIQAQDWNSMLNAGLGPALNAIARQMGITTAQLKTGLSDGSISVQKFQDALIQLDQKGGGGMASLQKIAHDSTNGIGTGMENARTAVVRGIADMVNAIGASNISGAISSLGILLEGLFRRFADVITFIEQHRVVIAITAGVIMAFLVPALISWTIAAGAAAIATIAATWPIIAIGAAIGLAAYLIVSHWNSIKGAFQEGLRVISSVIGFIGGLIGSLINFMRGVPGAAASAFSGLYNIMTAPFREAINFIHGAVNDIKNAVSSVTNVGGNLKSGASNLLHKIPGFAGGVTNFSGGLALVGEQGPELVNLPKGSNVTNSRDTQNALAGSGISIAFHGPVYMRNEQETQNVGAQLARQLQAARAGAF